MTFRSTGELPREQVAARAGVDPAYVTTLVDAEILSTSEAGGFSPGDVRRVRILRTLEQAGLPLQGIAAAIRSGEVSLAFMDHPFTSGLLR